MKKILITGANSYIGTSFESYIRQWPDEYQVDTIDMVDSAWRNKSFSSYDVAYHVAGIAHIKETKKNAHLYYEINRDLAIEVAKKAKGEGVKQFIYLSSMSVYGMDTGVITKDTIPMPKSHYGKSKLQAEEQIKKLQSTGFDVCIMRPPMVYGKGCKGNFKTLVKLVNKSPVFPNIGNQRSMIYIKNLSAFAGILISEKRSGIYFPQNKTYGQTMDIAKLISEISKKKICFSIMAGVVVRTLRPWIPVVKKSFGDLIYHDLDDLNNKYYMVEFSESIRQSIT